MTVSSTNTLEFIEWSICIINFEITSILEDLTIVDLNDSIIYHAINLIPRVTILI